MEVPFGLDGVRRDFVHYCKVREIAGEVWIESHQPSILGVKRIEKGSFVFGGVTIGVGGPKEARGVPSFGEGVVIGPGVICTGPVEVPRGSVLGPNAVVVKSLPKEGVGWIGAPAKEWPGPREALVPRIGGLS